jgi:D-alanyl-D-alanine carboxypeptidase
MMQTPRLFRCGLLQCVLFSVFLVFATAQAASQPFDQAVKARLAAMLAEKYEAAKSSLGLPEGAGILAYLESPRGALIETAGLPSGVDEHWHYRIASVSKTFTAASIMLLDQMGKLKIDDVVAWNMPGGSIPYLPDTPEYAIPYRNEITIRQLLSHRAGIFDVFNNPVPESSAYPYAGNIYNFYVFEKTGDFEHSFDADEIVAVISNNALSTNRPGVEYHYSDTGYTILAKIVERVSGERYDEFLERHFLGPLGLSRTSAPWKGDDFGLPSPYLDGFTNIGSGFAESTEDNMSCQVGPGNIISTPFDMARWIRSLFSERSPLTKEQQDRMIQKPEGNPNYALGISSNAGGYGHTGAHPGYVNLVGYSPEDDVALVVVLSFIDYTNFEKELKLLLDVSREIREIAGYPTR